MDLQKTLDWIARLTNEPEEWDRCRSGDHEIQIQEREDGELEVVVLQRLASVQVEDLRVQEDG